MKKGSTSVATALTLCLLSLTAAPMARAQEPFQPASSLNALSAPANPNKKHRKKDGKDQGQPSGVPPNIAIPVVPLGFAPPSSSYISYRFAQVSLHFLDENTLLFTFRVPTLIARERPAEGAQTSGMPSSGVERRIRAVVLSLPSGKVTAEALWSLHDYAPYTWALKDGKFLLRDQNLIQTGNASLKLEPYLRFPGPIHSLELDPTQQLLVANTTEQPAADPASNPPTAAATITAGEKSPDAPDAGSTPSPQSLLRIFRMETGKVLLFSRVPGLTHLPLDGEGYYEALRGKGNYWLINFQHFKGASNQLLQIESTCAPSLDVPAPAVVLASGCTSNGGRRLTAITQGKQRLWDVSLPPTQVWPLLTHATNGSRVARATLQVARPVGPTSPLDAEDIRAQLVQVYDLATGKLALSTPANPVLDGGGNFALSPSGNRVAVLNAGQIQVFDLPAAPALPPPAP